MCPMCHMCQMRHACRVVSCVFALCSEYALTLLHLHPSRVQRNLTPTTTRRDSTYPNPVSKLFMLGMLKFSAMDQQGMGVEMEGGKPGWNDAMNGLPGLLGRYVYVYVHVPVHTHAGNQMLHVGAGAFCPNINLLSLPLSVSPSPPHKLTNTQTHKHAH